MNVDASSFDPLGYILALVAGRTLVKFATGDWFSSSRVKGNSTAASTVLWQEWLRSCSVSHDACRAIRHRQKYTPTRLIEILSTNKVATKWRVVKPETDLPQRYCTLSHCWGKSDHLKLENKTYAAFQAYSPLSDLPRTYQDACSVVTTLGLSLLWIDSLCIFQDDNEDWKIESTKMGKIYAGAVCNIAASWATDGSKGIFRERDLEILTSDTACPLERMDREPQIMEMGMYYKDIPAAPLNHRAWVLQERYMAVCQLSFGRNQVYWECHETSASEQFPSGIPSSGDITKPSLCCDTKVDLLTEWRKIIQAYSMCRLTFEKDKLIALAGLAAEARAGLNDKYIAGMWKTGLSQQLTWKAIGTGKALRINTGGGPTWSWTSINGPVDPSSTDYMGNPKTSIIKIIDLRADSDDPSGLHNFKSVELRIRALGQWCKLTRDTDRSASRIGRVDFVLPCQIEQFFVLPRQDKRWLNEYLELYWDERVGDARRHIKSAERPRIRNERLGDLLFVFVTYEEGLILSRSERGDGSMRRIGMFTWDDNGLATAVASRLGMDEDDLAKIYDWKSFERRYDRDVDLEDPRLADIVHDITII